jgi:NAD(P)-dependent dehydrogenase (short-subunit alcohol dehydrogenase family)
MLISCGFPVTLDVLASQSSDGNNDGGADEVRLLCSNSTGQDRDLAGTVVLVSGGGRGLGRLLAIALARAGAPVGLLGRRAGAAVGEIERAGGTVAAAIADVTDRDVLSAAVEKFQRRRGPVDLLINNAGVAGPIGASWDVDLDERRRALEANTGGAFTLTWMDDSARHDRRWVHGRFAAGQGADPDQAVRLIVDLARGRGDVLSGRHLSGRHLSADDDLAASSRRSTGSGKRT